MTNFILILVIAAIVSGAVWYIRREKRRGVQCVGCPDAATCSGKCAGCTGNCNCK